MVDFKFYLPFILIFALFIYSLASENDLLLIITVSVVGLGAIAYYFNSIYEIFARWIRDKNDGDLEAIVEFISATYRKPSYERLSSSPGLIVGNFKILSCNCEGKHNLVDKIVSLEGNIKHSNLVVGKKYKIKMKIHSKKLIYVESYISSNVSGTSIV